MTKSTITREPITHDLKIYPEFFSAVCTGVKRAELRKNDRDYLVGDTLHLMETPRGSCHRTGEYINVTITHIADVGEWMPGYVLLSVEIQERRKAAMDSEPVILYRERNPYNGLTTGWQELTENEFSFLKENAGENAEFLALYRHAQPAPVVPDDVSIFEAAIEECKTCDSIDEHAWNHGVLVAMAKYESCRAAMLHAGNSPTQSDCCPAQNSASPAQDGNSPATSDNWQVEAEKLAEMHGMSFVLFRHGEAPQCADPTKVVISFTDKGLGHDALPAAPQGVIHG